MLLQRFVRRRGPSTFAASEQQQRCLRSFSSSLPCLQLVRARTLLGSCEGVATLEAALRVALEDDEDDPPELTPPS